MSDADPLRGLKVLVVEDEALVAMLVEDMLGDFGCQVIGAAANVRQALEMIAAEAPEVAVMDVNLGGDPIWPVADALMARGVPFVLATGYGESGVDERYRGGPVLQKPFEQGELEACVRRAAEARR